MWCHISLANQHPVSDKRVNCSSVGEGRALKSDLGSVNGVRGEWLHLKYAANCERRNRLFVFCFSEAPQKFLCLSIFTYDLSYVLSWIQTISCLKIDPRSPLLRAVHLHISHSSIWKHWMFQFRLICVKTL